MSRAISSGRSTAVPIIYRDALIPTAECGDWFVLRTCSRQEKILANELSSQRIANYLPLMTVRRQYCGRDLQVEVPVFPCQLFLRGTPQQVDVARQTGRILEVQQIVDQSRVEVELQSLAIALSARLQMEGAAYRQKGVPVRAIAGPLRGAQGKLHERDRTLRLILELEALQQAVSVEIDGADVEYLR